MILRLLQLAVCCASYAIAQELRGTIIDVTSDKLGKHRFHQIPGEHSSTGRPAYASEDEVTFLFHIQIEPEVAGVGRWVIADRLWATDVATQFIDSWAPSPCLVNSVRDNPALGWMQFSTEEEWVLDESFNMLCFENIDDIVYLDVPSNQYVTGFYFKIARAEGAATVDLSAELGDIDPSKPQPATYMKLMRQPDERKFYLFRLESRWVVGDTPGQDMAIAFVVDHALTPADIVEDTWFFHTESPEINEGEGGTMVFKQEFVEVIVRAEEDGSIYESLRRARSLRNFPGAQNIRGGLYTMRNGVEIPAVGLGTGGLGEANMVPTTTKALQMGYRLLDLAREYQNEDDVRQIFETTAEDPLTPKPYEVFLLTKVWPTDMGFGPTSNAIFESRVALHVAAVNNYMLHWPVCDHSVFWMHCDSTVDPEATWHQSYKALEKAYAEGDILSIGISNFDIYQLQELSATAQTLPHLLQNYATIGQVDEAVFQWCNDNHVMFQPYAVVRNLKNASPEINAVLTDIARIRSKSPHSVVYRYFIEKGATIIPRSTKPLHMQQNLDVLQWELTAQDIERLDTLNV